MLTHGRVVGLGFDFELPALESLETSTNDNQFHEKFKNIECLGSVKLYLEIYVWSSESNTIKTRAL
jgi:hypothetical protein